MRGRCALCCILAVLDVTSPQFDRLVILQSGRGDDVLGRVAGRAEDHVRVAAQLLYNFLCLQVPYVHLIVL